MQNTFHTDDPSVVSHVAYLAEAAAKDGRRFRLNVDSDGNLKIKVGEGMWTAPIRSTPDPYRG